MIVTSNGTELVTQATAIGTQSDILPIVPFASKALLAH